MEALALSPQDRLINQLLILCPGKGAEISNILSGYDIYFNINDGGKDLQGKIDQFLTMKKTEGMKQGTSDTYRVELRVFARHVNKPVDQITIHDIRGYIGMFSHLKPATIATKQSVLKSFFGWLAREEVITKDPSKKLRAPKKPKRLPKALTVEELELIRDCCDSPRERALVEVFYATGARLSEVTQMNCDSINFVEKCTKIIGKGDKERTVYFSDKALFHLKKYLKNREDKEEALFITERKPSRRMQNRSVQRAIAKIAARSGIHKDITPHVFRHTFATLMLNNGAEISCVQGLLGHEHASTTQIYAVATEQHKQDQYKKFLVQ